MEARQASPHLYDHLMPGVLVDLRHEREYDSVLDDPAFAPVRHLLVDERARWTRFFFGRPGVAHVVLPS